MKYLMTTLITVCCLQIANAIPVAKIESAVNSGTTFFISKNESITAKHVCEKSNKFYYLNKMRQSYISTKIVMSSKYDLCYVQWAGNDDFRSIIQLAPMGSVFKVLTFVGFPKGIFTISVNNYIGEKLLYNEWLGYAQFNVGPGASGGPVINESDEVVGVLVTHWFPKTDNGFVPLRHIIEFLEDEVK